MYAKHPQIAKRWSREEELERKTKKRLEKVYGNKQKGSK